MVLRGLTASAGSTASEASGESSAAAPGAPRLALWVVPVADLGGVARHVLDATRHGVEGWRIVVLCPDGALADHLAAQGTAVLRAPISPADGPRTAVRALRRVLARLRPDLLHTHLAFADLVGVAAVTGLRSGRGTRLRVVSTEHGISGVRGLYQSSPARARAIAAAHRARLLRTDRVIAVSASTRDQIAAQWGSAEKIVVVRNGVDPVEGDGPTVASASAASPRVLSLSRLAPEKRIDLALEAFARVRAERPGATFTIAGTGTEEQRLHDRAQALGLDGAVAFVGHVEPADVMPDHDVLVQLSTWENLSYTLLDAVAHGLGVVATDVGGNREILPEQCLVAASDAAADGGPGRVAALVIEQAEEPSRRPSSRWPADGLAQGAGHRAGQSLGAEGSALGIGDVAGMTAGIAAVYDAACAEAVPVGRPAASVGRPAAPAAGPGRPTHREGVRV